MVIALVILLAVLKQYCRCVNTQITSQELQEEQEEPITTQTSSDGVPAPVQNAKYVPEMRFYKVCLVKVKLWSLLHPMETLMLDLQINIKETFHYTQLFLLHRSYKP